MSADYFHARIEKGIRAEKMIHDFDDFQAVVGKPVPIEHFYFHSYENGVGSGASTHKPLQGPVSWSLLSG